MVEIGVLVEPPELRDIDTLTVRASRYYPAVASYLLVQRRVMHIDSLKTNSFQEP